MSPTHSYHLSHSCLHQSSLVLFLTIEGPDRTGDTSTMLLKEHTVVADGVVVEDFAGEDEDGDDE